MYVNKFVTFVSIFTDFKECKQFKNKHVYTIAIIWKVVGPQKRFYKFEQSRTTRWSEIKLRSAYLHSNNRWSKIKIILQQTFVAWKTKNYPKFHCRGFVELSYCCGNNHKMSPRIV